MPAEKGYLGMLAARLKLEPGLVAHLHANVDEALSRGCQQRTSLCRIGRRAVPRHPRGLDLIAAFASVAGKKPSAMDREGRRNI